MENRFNFPPGSASAPLSWGAYGKWPEALPEAREYWLVFRAERPEAPDSALSAPLLESISELRRAARRSSIRIAGIQLDIDCPTGKLSQYADFLRELRKGLPKDEKVSVTALLDWFRDGTSIADLIQQTDEFAPQFYDVASTRQPESPDNWGAIAQPIDLPRWAPRFNRFGKPFRIGIATFGRARSIPGPNSQQASVWGLRLFSDLSPSEVAASGSLDLRTEHSAANELILTYRATKRTRLGYNTLEAGDSIQFIRQTPEAIRDAVQNARRMGGNCAGVAFFRWPKEEEDLVMDPDEVLAAAGLAPPRPKPLAVEAVNGRCAAVYCVDLYLTNADPFASREVRYHVRSSTDLDYFLPAEGAPARMSGPAEIQVTVAPFAGRRRMALGRAVNAERAEFRLEENR